MINQPVTGIVRCELGLRTCNNSFWNQIQSCARPPDNGSLLCYFCSVTRQSNCQLAHILVTNNCFLHVLVMLVAMVLWMTRLAFL